MKTAKTSILRAIISFLISIFFIPFLKAQDAPTQVSEDQNAFSIESNDLRALQNSVNLFTGSVAFPMGLMDVGRVGGMSYPVSINYNSEVQRQVETWNKEVPTGILGLGWGFSTPRIIVNNKSTGTREDDDFFINGNGVNSRLIKIRNTTRSSNAAWEFITVDHTNWRIYYLHGSERWEIVTDDGSLITYGGQNSNPSAVQWVVAWDNWIGNSALTTGQSRQAVAWDLAEVRNQWNDWTRFSYLKIENRVSNNPSVGQYHTEASYLESIENSFGSEVSLYYGDKFAYEYEEPHTEQVEPDAYQERYEDKFLERLEFRNHNDKLLGKVHLSYNIVDYRTSGHTTNFMRKRLLASIERENEWGERSGKVDFRYKNNAASNGALKGMLDRVSLENGSRIDFNYKAAGQIIANSELNKNINAPGTGYAHPRIWHGPNYSVVAWRNTNTDHVKVFGYIWNGKWNEQELFDIDDVQTENTPGFVDPNRYKDFRVSLGENFFVVMSKGNGDWREYSAHIDQNKGDVWKSVNGRLVGSNDWRLLSGQDFYALLRTDNGQIRTRDLVANEWRLRSVKFPNGTYYGTASNNYIFVLDEDGNDIRILYKNSLNQWITRHAADNVEPSTQQPSSFRGANGFVVGILHNNEEAVFNWDKNYTTNKKTNLGHYDPRFQRIENFGNELFSIKSTGGGTSRYILGRFDGSNWNLSTQNNLLFEHSLGENYATTGYLSGQQYLHQRFEYDANSNSWYSGTTLPLYENDPGQNVPVPFPHASFPNAIFKWPHFVIRSPGNIWTTSSTTSTTTDINTQSFSFMKGPSYIYHRGNTNKIVFYQLVNGTPEQQIFDFGKFSGDERYYQPGLRTFNSFNSSIPRLATNIELHRIEGTQVEGARRDYPIDHITYFDGYQSYHTSFSFDASSAKFDPSGNIVQYGEAEVFPGNSTQASTYGSTQYEFFNGLPENVNTSNDNSRLFYGKFLGQQKSTEVFNSTGATVSSNENTFFHYTPSTIQSGSNFRIRHGYTVPKSTTNFLGGVRNSTVTEYIVATGQPNLTRESALNLTGRSDRRTTTVTYGWQVYPGMDTQNILNVPVSTQVDYNTKIISHRVVKMREQSGTWRVNKTFIWEGTGTDDFSNYWTGPDPTANWRRTNQIARVNERGLPEETRDIDNFVFSTYYDDKGYQPLLTVSNANHVDLFADDFNKENSSNIGGNWSEASGNWSLLNGNVGIRSNGNGYLLLQKRFNTSLVNDFIAEFRYRTFAGNTSGYIAFEFDRNEGDLGQTSPQNGLQVRFFKNGTVGLYDGTTRLGAAGSISGSSAAWRDVRVVRNDDEFRLYIDGDLALNVAISSWTGFGRHFGFEIKNTASELDDVRIYPVDGRAEYVAYENHYQHAEKRIEGTGFTLRNLVNINGAPVANINESGNVTSTIMGSTSQFRRGNFSSIDPDLILSTTINGDQSYFEAFDEEPRYLWNRVSGGANSQISVEDGRLVWITPGGNTGNPDQYQLTMPEGITGKVGLEFDLHLDGNATGNTFGFAIGSRTASLTGNTQLASRAVFNSSETLKSGSTTITSQLNPNRLHRIKVIFDQQNVDYYLDGKLVKENVPYTNQVPSIGRIILFNEGKGGSATWYIDNLVVYQDPNHTITYLDTGGKTRQSINEVLDNHIMVSEYFYDPLTRNHARTKSVKINDHSLAFRSGFVTAFSGTTVTGEVANLFNGQAFYRTRFENSPLGRTLEQGLPDADYQIGGNTSQQFFAANSNAVNSSYYLNAEVGADAFFANRTMDADGGESISFTDTWGREVMTKVGKRDIATADISTDFVTLSGNQSTDISSAEISSPIRQTIDIEVSLFHAIGLESQFKIGTTPGGSELVNSILPIQQAVLEANTTYYITLIGGAVLARFEYINSYNEVNVNDFVTTKYGYDDYNRPYKIYYPNYFHPPVGSVPEDFISETTYDHFGQPLLVTTPDGGTSRSLYDVAGKVRFTQDANGAANNYVFYSKYDELDRVIEEGYWYRPWTGLTATTVVPPSAIWKKRYEYHGFVEQAYLRDVLYRIKINNDEDQDVEAMEEYDYDDRLRVVTTRKWTYAFSSEPATIIYDYNQAGQLISEDYGHGTPVVHYSYYSDGSLKAIGTATVVDQFAAYEYGTNGAVSREHLNNRAFSRDYSYDGLDRLTQLDDSYFRETLQYESGADATTQYYTGKIGRTTFSFKAGQWGSAPRPSNYYYSYSYNDQGMLLSANHSTDNAQDVGVGAPVSYDAIGNIVSIQRGLTTKNFQYHSGTNRVKNTNGSGASNYLYDEIGNVVGKGVSDVEVLNGSKVVDEYEGVSYKLEGLNYELRLTDGFRFNAQSSSASFEASLGANGGGTQLTYDRYIDRTTSVSEDSYSVDFQYGADDYRIYKQNQTGNAVRKTLYIRGQGLSPGLVRTIEPDGTIHQVFFIYGPNGAIATQIDGVTYYHLKDHVGSTRVIVNENNAVAAHYNYRPFGGLINSYVGIANNYLFQGQERDAQTGLYNFNARLYDEDLGRFLSVDPMAGSFPNYSPYSGFFNNPLQFTDPNGEEPISFGIVIAIAAVVGGTTNTLLNLENIDNFGEGLAFFGVGALAAGGAVASAGAIAAAGSASAFSSGIGIAFAGGGLLNVGADAIFDNFDPEMSDFANFAASFLRGGRAGAVGFGVGAVAFNASASAGTTLTKSIFGDIRRGITETIIQSGQIPLNTDGIDLVTASVNGFMNLLGNAAEVDNPGRGLGFFAASFASTLFSQAIGNQFIDNRFSRAASGEFIGLAPGAINSLSGQLFSQTSNELLNTRGFEGFNFLSVLGRSGLGVLSGGLQNSGLSLLTRQFRFR